MKINMKYDPAKQSCSQCGSDLILLKTVVEKYDISPSITVSTYRCSNKACQDEFDKNSILREKKFKEQAEMQKKRNKNRTKSL